MSMCLFQYLRMNDSDFFDSLPDLIPDPDLDLDLDSKWNQGNNDSLSPLHPWKFKTPVSQQIKLTKFARFRTCKF